MVDVGSGELYYYGNDQLGTPQILTDSTNTVVWEGVYKPFGEAEVNPNSSVVNNFRFPGQYYDGETGLHYNYFRYYDPETGRYLTADPIGLFGGINLYAYVLNNPVNWVDPKGLFIWGAIGKYIRTLPGKILGTETGKQIGYDTGVFNEEIANPIEQYRFDRVGKYGDIMRAIDLSFEQCLQKCARQGGAECQKGNDCRQNCYDETINYKKELLW